MESFTGIVKRAKNGDEVAFTEIFNAYNNKIYYFAMNHVKSSQDAEDIVQNTFTEVFKSISALSDETVFKSWLYTIAKRQIVKLYQKTERTPGVHAEDIDVIADGLWDNSEFLPENILQTEEMKNAVAELIRSLPEAQKTAVLLYYYEEMSIKEIAEIQECSVGTVKSRLNYARKYIKAEIEKRRKKGNYVIGVAPLPLLTLLLRELAARDTLSQEAATTIFAESCAAADIALTEATAGLITTQTAGTTAASAGATAAVTAAAKGGMTLLTKAIIGGVGLFAFIAVVVFILLNNPDAEDYVPVFANGGNGLDGVVSDTGAEQQLEEITDAQVAEPEHIHVWADATCQVPQTCIECGETQGDALLHELTAANFQQAAICMVCGEAEGEPLMPYFRERGIAINLELGVPVEYVTVTYDRHDLPTVGTFTLTDYQVVPYTEEFEAKEGFEWRIIRMTSSFSDDNARRYGTLTTLLFTDYFSGWTQETTDFALDTGWEFTTLINHKGINYEVLVIGNYHRIEWIRSTHAGSEFIRESTWALRVPIGYDGIVFAYRNSALALAEEAGLHLTASERMDENTLFFRLD